MSSDSVAGPSVQMSLVLRYIDWGVQCINVRKPKTVVNYPLVERFFGFGIDDREAFAVEAWVRTEDQAARVRAFEFHEQF